MLVFTWGQLRVVEFNAFRVWLYQHYKVLTLIKVLVTIAGFYFRGKLVPQSMQLSLKGFQARYCCLEEPWLNNAHLDTKVVYVPPERWIVCIYFFGSSI